MNLAKTCCTLYVHCMYLMLFQNGIEKKDLYLTGHVLAKVGLSLLPTP